jgi:hypothetical protein
VGHLRRFGRIRAISDQGLPPTWLARHRDKVLRAALEEAIDVCALV